MNHSNKHPSHAHMQVSPHLRTQKLNCAHRPCLLLGGLFVVSGWPLFRFFVLADTVNAAARPVSVASCLGCYATVGSSISLHAPFDMPIGLYINIDGFSPTFQIQPERCWSFRSGSFQEQLNKRTPLPLLSSTFQTYTNHKLIFSSAKTLQNLIKHLLEAAGLDRHCENLFRRACEDLNLLEPVQTPVNFRCTVFTHVAHEPGRDWENPIPRTWGGQTLTRTEGLGQYPRAGSLQNLWEITETSQA